MNVAIIGTTDVGLVTGACLADFGHAVTCVDSAPERIEALVRGVLPFSEPGRAELGVPSFCSGRVRAGLLEAVGV